MNRRTFIRSAAAASLAGSAFPAVLRSQGAIRSPNNRLNIACIGVGGRGRDAIAALKDENLVAFCDVDEARAAKTFAEFPAVPRYRDFRKLFDELGPQIDAVTVSTPDHMHFPVAMAAIALGKHVFVEKPMTHTVWEARTLARAAREKNVATQMGNQGHAGEGARLLREWVQAGVLGEVREVYSWTDRPGRWWKPNLGDPDHGKFMPVVPSTLDWDLWLGVARRREYDPAFVPHDWRAYWEFGSGALGDMGCHIMDGAFWALDLTAPTAIEAVAGKVNGISLPSPTVVTYHFPARGTMPAVKWTWYDGGLLPPLPDDFPELRVVPENRTLLIGSKATAVADTYYGSVRILPEAKMQEMSSSLPPKTIPRIEGGHFAEWVRACKGGPPAGSNFDYASRLTETVLCGMLPVRAHRRIEWDSANLRVTNVPSANQYITKEYRPGFLA